MGRSLGEGGAGLGEAERGDIPWLLFVSTPPPTPTPAPGSQQGLPLAAWSWKLTHRRAQDTWPVWPRTSLSIPLGLSFFICERGHHPDVRVCGNGWR